MMTFNQEPPNSTKRVRKENEELQKLWDLYHEKFSKLRHALATETDAAKKFQLEQQIKEVQTQLQDIEKQLDEREATPQQPGLRHSQNNETQQELPNREIPEIDREIKQVEAKLRRFKKPAIISSFFSFLRALRIKLYTCKKRLVIFTVFILCGVSVVFMFYILRLSNSDVCKSPAADVSSIDFSPNGEYLATASLDKTVRILKVTETTDQKNGSDIPCQLETEGVVAVKFSPDGKYLATATLNSANLWNVNHSIISSKHQDLSHNLTKPNNEPPYKNSVVTIDFSQDGNYVATASADGEIKVWNMKNLKEVKVLTPPQTQRKAYIVSVSFSHDGNYIATTDVNDTANVWELKANDSTFTPQLLKSISNVTAIAFLKDGNKINLVTGSADGTIQVRDISDLENPASLPKDNSLTYVMDVSVSPGGKFITALSLDQKVYIWDWKNKKKFTLVEDQNKNTHVTAIAFSSDDKYLAIANIDDTRTDVTVLNTEKGSTTVSPFTPEGNGLVMAVAFSPTHKDEVYLATARADGSINMRKLPE
ncbi:hypothetical protein F7734_17630 [Scytonema sp. UIC 10036]|uniref:hypothetical protein n=1 Tax=Scytonema sp. UIC 10036 TaxID=2304196 RepID=UPI0012DA3C4E|nr:hypothetical protein [Scytonema sp. UIC 10036]MUG94112.1 hypothetical protein [Scytonema sp. UIC 10036]